MSIETDDKSLPAYVGLGTDLNKLRGQKARPLLDFIRLGLSLEELKIFDIFLGRIDSSHPEISTVIFSKKDLEMLFGVKKINIDSLRGYLRHLLQPVEIETREKVTLLNLFSQADIEKGYHGVTNIVLTCSEQAKKYIFDMTELGYVPFLTPEICSLSTKYRYIMYFYVRENLFRKKWEVGFEELRTKLGCNAEKYKQLKHFKYEILNSCKKEIEEKTSIRFDFNYKKDLTGNIIFCFSASDSALPLIETECIESKNQIFDSDYFDEQAEEIYGSELYAMYAKACKYEFSAAEIELIALILTRINIYKDKNTNSIEWGRTRYLEEKYSAMCIEAEKKIQSGKFIADRFLYFKGMLEADASVGLTY